MRTVNVRSEDLTKITLTNAGIDKQINLKRDYIYKIEKNVSRNYRGFRRFITTTIPF